MQENEEIEKNIIEAAKEAFGERIPSGLKEKVSSENPMDESYDGKLVLRAYRPWFPQRLADRLSLNKTPEAVIEVGDNAYEVFPGQLEAFNQYLEQRGTEGPEYKEKAIPYNKKVEKTSQAD